MWPDTLGVVRAYLAENVQARVVTRTPANLEQSLPLVRVRLGPGTDDGITSVQTIDAESFTSSADPAAAWQLAEEVRQAMHALRGRVVDGVLIDAVRTSTTPTEVDWGNPAITRLVAGYPVETRQKRTQ